MIDVILFFESCILFIFASLFLYLGIKNRNKMKFLYFLPFFFMSFILLFKVVLNIQEITSGIIYYIGNALILLDIVFLVFVGGKNEI